MNDNFKNLNINRNNLNGLIKSYCEANIEGEFKFTEIISINDKNNVYQAQVESNGKISLLNFYYNRNGTTTISYKVGKNQALSLEISRYIKQNGVVDDRNNIHSTIKSVDTESFELLVEYISEEVDTDIIEKLEIPYGYKYKFKSNKFNDSLTLIHYYTKNKLTIQGKPLYLYSEVISFLSEFIGFEEIIDSQAAMYNIDLKAEDVRTEINECLEKSYDYLGENLKSVLSPAFALRKIEIEMDDYSVFVYPALRALEGYLKKIIFEKNIEIDRNFNMFEEHSINRGYYCLKYKIAQELGCSKTRNCLEKIYNFLRVNRHPLFHASYDDSSILIIKDRKEANRIVNETIALIEETYCEIEHTIKCVLN
ncbi:type II toxin-antitoxin system RnlA family toxin [Romboutsia sp. 1001713B170131_170501_G6]|uniref:type II toxin-antitoxin system RnlA family toxin n=1 Tax=Romboutsia sp. 1001713B170131_170501_G6 TaxID=2787108 RepID=UPI0018A8BDB5|nr:type II toxin-antitoxin system RnlA family toxin [Romboutsia sp. 1001713B170131_170501_G6]